MSDTTTPNGPIDFSRYATQGQRPAKPKAQWKDAGRRCARTTPSAIPPRDPLLARVLRALAERVAADPGRFRAMQIEVIIEEVISPTMVPGDHLTTVSTQVLVAAAQAFQGGQDDQALISAVARYALAAAQEAK